MDAPEDVVRLITAYPEFRLMYGDAYEICRNTERVMYMFSKELLELDRNTAAYMVDVMQKEINEQKQALDEKEQEIDEQKQALDTAHARIAELEAMLGVTNNCK